MATDRKISELFRTKKCVLSYEVYPPPKVAGIAVLVDHLRRLSVFDPDYISVTYGAGGSTQETSIAVLEAVNASCEAAVMAHFTCVGTDREFINAFLERLRRLGIVNILALRGDPPTDDPAFDFSQQSFHYASELVAHLLSVTDMCIGVAGYPEGHVEAPSLDADWDNVKKKIDAGGEFIITQLFFDNRDYFAFRDGMAARGVDVPIVPGVLPVESIKRLQRIVNLSGSKLSPAFQRLVDRYGDDPEGFRQASVEHTQTQVRELMANGVPGIHYYILNRSEMTTAVIEGL